MVPDRVVQCRDESPAPNHGLFVLLDSTSCQLMKDSVAKILVYADYNVINEARSSNELALAECKTKDSNTKFTVSNVLVNGVPSTQCMWKENGGKVVIRIFSQLPQGNDPSQWINLESRLDTQENRLQDDKKLFDLIVNSLSITK